MRSHRPDEMMRRQVEALAGYGVPETEIAGLLTIDPKTLRRHYRHELDHGHTRANAKVAENLYRKATGEGREAVTAAIFWLKARAGWRETTRVEHEGATPIQRIVLAPLEPLEPGSTPRSRFDGDEATLVISTGVPRSPDSCGSGR